MARILLCAVAGQLAGTHRGNIALRFFLSSARSRQAAANRKVLARQMHAGAFHLSSQRRSPTDFVRRRSPDGWSWKGDMRGADGHVALVGNGEITNQGMLGRKSGCDLAVGHFRWNSFRQSLLPFANVVQPRTAALIALVAVLPDNGLHRRSVPAVLFPVARRWATSPG